MAESTEEDVSDEESPSTDLWAQVRDDILTEFGYNADISVRHYSNHIEARVVPERVKARLEETHDDVTVVPYQAFQMAIRREEEGTAVDSASRVWPSCAMRCHHPTFIIPSL